MSASEQELAELRAANRALCRQLGERDQEAHDLRIENDELKAKLGAAVLRIERMTRRTYGWSSERHHPGQQALDLGQPVILPAVSDSDTITPSSSDGAAPTTATSATATTATTPAPAPATGPAAPRRPRPPGSHPGRRRLPEGAEIVEQDIVVPEPERLDAHGQPLPLLGYKITDKWDFRPGTYLVRRFRRAIYGRPFSEAHDRIVATMPACLIPRGQMTDAALIHTVVEKFADHLPLYRQEQRAARQGVRLSRATLVNHVTAVAGALAGVVGAIAEAVRAAPYLHLDDTPVRVLDPGRGHTATGRIWVYRSAEQAVFRFSPTREGRHPAEFLGAYRGFIVADAYAGHERLYGDDLATPIGCWAHVRRKFHEIREREPLAQVLVEAIGKLYALEKDIRLVSCDERRHVRQARAAPLIADIRQRLDRARGIVLPASDLGRAVAYALTRWPTLTPYLDHGMLPIDNNPAENALRPWAVGRKNWLFLGSHAGGERAALIATIIENCRMHALDPVAYLTDTVAHLHRGRTDYTALTPRAAANLLDAHSA